MEETKELTVVGDRETSGYIEDYAMPIESLVKQVALIQEAMSKVMKKDEHYGTIPGTPKPTLLKPGAEKLCLLFRLGPKYTLMEKVRKERFIAYTVCCELTHTPTGTFVASGIGSCNSYEAKYRYRFEDTGERVPDEYWKHRDKKHLGSVSNVARKVGKEWHIFRRVQNDNPWDLDNTLVKMACKRALIAAVLNATAASDIFTQDVEDLPEEMLTQPENKEKATKKEKKQTSKKSATASKKKVRDITDKQKEQLYELMREKGLTDQECADFFSYYHPKTYAEAEDFIKHFEDAYVEWKDKQEDPFA